MRGVGSVIAAIAIVAMSIGAGVSAESAPSRVAAPPVPAPLAATGTPLDIATGLKVPWSILQLHDGDDTVLVSERDTGVIQRITSTGGLDPLGTIAGVHHISDGEGGLLGLATLVDGGGRWIYAYFSTASDNRIVRMRYNDPGDPADATLGAPQVILSGLKVSKNHNGGRIAFGPDGMLYATVGDVNIHSLAQDKNSLNGKILRMTPTGGVPASGNPFPNSLVYSMGHRHPQGLAWDADGQLWATEFGQGTWDEFNKIVPGGNYGWPVVEGATTDPRFINPWVQWPTQEASPSGLVYIDGTFFMAALKGTRLYSIYVDKAAGTAQSVSTYVNELGRIRDVAEGPGGTLWMLTNNTARGVVRPGDDRLVQVDLVTAGQVTGVIDCATCRVPNAVRIDPSLQRRVGGTWLDYQTIRADWGATPSGAFTFPAVAPGDYRIVARDIGGDGYLTATSGTFTIAAGQVVDRGTIRLRGTQLARDLSGDGINDLLAITSAKTLVSYAGTGAGAFGTSHTIQTGWRDASTAQAGDFDGDGFPDVVTRDGGGVLWLHSGDGAGGFLGTHRIARGPRAQNLLIGAGDFDGDGTADLISRDIAGHLWLSRGDGAGGLRGATVDLGSGWAGFTAIVPVGDFTGDKKADLVVRTRTGDLVLYRGNGTGGFASSATIGRGWQQFTALLSVGDVTGDARADLLARDAAGALWVYRGNGTGGFAGSTKLGGNWNAVTFAS